MPYIEGILREKPPIPLTTLNERNEIARLTNELLPVSRAAIRPAFPGFVLVWKASGDRARFSKRVRLRVKPGFFSVTEEARLNER